VRLVESSAADDDCLRECDTNRKCEGRRRRRSLFHYYYYYFDDVMEVWSLTRMELCKIGKGEGLKRRKWS
jgi:hypothetical protein